MEHEQASEPPAAEAPNKLGFWIDWVRRQRAVLAAIAVIPVVATLGLALASLPDAPHYEFPCPIYPNGTVAMTASFYESCPLEYPDFVAAVMIDGERESLFGEEEVRAQIHSAAPVRFLIQPVQRPAREVALAPILVRPGEAITRLAAAWLLAMILSAAVLLTAVRARVPASLPFSLIHASAGVGIVTAVAGWTSSAFEVPAAIARATMAGAVAHLGLVFPQRRGLVEQMPELIAGPYLFAYIICAVEIDAAYGGSAVSAALAQRLLMVGIGLAGGILFISCAMAARESPSHLARGQARVFLMGIASLLAPAEVIWLVGAPSTRLAAITLLAALLPFPVGYAISRYQVDDLDASMRRLVAHVLYLSLWATGFFVALQLVKDRLDIPEPLRHPTVVFSAIYAALLPVDAARGFIKRRVRSMLVSHRVDWDRLGLEFAQRIASQRTPEAVARAACDAIASGIAGADVAAQLQDGDVMRIGHATGRRAFTAPELASRLLASCEQPVVDLNRIDASDGPVGEAYRAGVEAIAKISGGGEQVLGCLLVYPTRRGRLLATSEHRWIATIARHAGSALAALRMEQDLRVAERFAARGKIQAELAHEIGKPLGVLELTAQKLANEIAGDDPLAPHLGKIARLAGLAREVARGALLGEDAQDGMKVAELVERACSEIRTLHGDGRIHVHQLPDAGELPGGYDRLVRVLVNLLDNAVRASAAGDVVELRASLAGSSLEVLVEDRGAGMSEEQARRAFDPFTTFRPGGSGLGLSISRQLVALLGGSIRLDSAPGRGTRAIVRLPLPAHGSDAI